MESNIDNILTTLEKESNICLREKFGEISKEKLIKILRVPFTGTILGFIEENVFIKFINSLLHEYPEYENSLRNYMKFYIAFRVAEFIAKGEIKNRVSKEALKHAIAVRIGANKAIPSDKYIYTIASEVLKIPTKILKKVLSINKRRKTDKRFENINNLNLTFGP